MCVYIYFLCSYNDILLILIFKLSISIIEFVRVYSHIFKIKYVKEKNNYTIKRGNEDSRINHKIVYEFELKLITAPYLDNILTSLLIYSRDCVMWQLTYQQCLWTVNDDCHQNKFIIVLEYCIFVGLALISC